MLCKSFIRLRHQASRLDRDEKRLIKMISVWFTSHGLSESFATQSHFPEGIVPHTSSRGQESDIFKKPPLIIQIIDRSR